MAMGRLRRATNLAHHLLPAWFPLRRDLGAGPGSLAHGLLERVADAGGGRVALVGWLHAMGERIDALRIDVDGATVAVLPPIRRDDVRAYLGAWPASEAAGFSTTVTIAPDASRPWRVVEIVALRGARDVGRLRLRHLPGYRDSLPTPPPHLTERVVSLRDPEAYWAGALQTAGEFFATLEAHARVGSIRRLLDWGCGCGRITSLFLRHAHVPEVHGCDIDGEAIAWCAANLPRGTFARIEPTPPTPYAGAFFDAIVSYSVFTHLTRDDQRRWLDEMHRVLRPGGLFLASVHGRFAATYVQRRDVRRDLDERGFSDRLLDPALDGIAPEGYYRSSYQTGEYVRREWSERFEVVDVVERSISHYQDLVVLRRRA
jgi:SAM-dependent methyltransferase